MPTFNIPKVNMEGFLTKIERLNRRARRLEVPEIEVTVLSTFEKVISSQKNFVTGEIVEVTGTFCEVEVKGASPKLAGWTLVAALDHLEAGNVLRTVPSWTGEVPDHFRTAACVCEHCNTIRRRLNSFVLLHEDGTWKQVGRNCLADFLGHRNPEALAAWAEILSDLEGYLGGEDEDHFGMDRVERHINLDALLQITRRIIAGMGYMSKAAAKRAYERNLENGDDFMPETTASHVLTALFGSPKAQAWLERKLPEMTEELIAEAAAAKEWACNLPGKSDFEWNLKLVAGSSSVGPKQYGLAVAIVGCYLNQLAREQERRAKIAADQEQAKASVWFGEVGKRAVYTLTLISTRELESEFGVTTLAIFKDQDGNRAKWFASRFPDMDIDGTYEVKATVKAHESYRGILETVLTRVAVQKDLTPKAEGAETPLLLPPDVQTVY